MYRWPSIMKGLRIDLTSFSSRLIHPELHPAHTGTVTLGRYLAYLSAVRELRRSCPQDLGLARCVELGSSRRENPRVGTALPECYGATVPTRAPSNAAQ